MYYIDNVGYSSNLRVCPLPVAPPPHIAVRCLQLIRIGIGIGYNATQCLADIHMNKTQVSGLVYTRMLLHMEPRPPGARFQA